MTVVFKDDVRRYCIAIFSVVAATQLRLLFTPWLNERVPFGTYLLAVVLTSWLVGTAPAIVALLLGVFAAAHYIIPPENSVLITDFSAVLSLIIYAIVGGVTIYLFDRTARQHAQARTHLKQIRRLSSVLQTNDRHKDEFLALLAHELRNPLAPIRSGLLLLQRPNLREKERTTVIKTLCRQLEQLIHIVDDLLEVSRFAYGRVILNRQPVDLRELVETAIEQAQSAFEERKHRLQRLIPSVPVPVNGDRIRIIQIITNLLTNAAKYTPREGRIQIVLEHTAGQATLSVSDNGIGITREMQRHIFELFARSDAAIRRDTGGLGLGLPIAKQFTDMHGGELRAYSEGADQGSRFDLILPTIPVSELKLSPLPDDQETTAGTTSSQSSTDEGTQPIRVLIVDDNVDAAETLAAILGYEGYCAVCAYDGFQALSMVGEFRPDVVLLDIGLPGMDGYEIARRLREEFILQPLTIIAVTGWGADEDLRKSHLAGIDHHMVKPVDPDKLTQLMRDSVVQI